MTSIRPYLLVAPVLAVAMACGKNDATPTNDARPPSVSPAAPTAVKTVAVEVGADGFSPSSITVKKGEPVTLAFKRTTDKTCATSVVFPELKLEKSLPLNEVVAIDVPTDRARTLAFQCGMAMYKSKVVVQ